MICKIITKFFVFAYSFHYMRCSPPIFYREHVLTVKLFAKKELTFVIKVKYIVFFRSNLYEVQNLI